MDELVRWLKKTGEVIAKYVPPEKERDYSKYQETIDVAIALASEKKAKLMPVDKLRNGIVYWLERDYVTQPWPIALHHIRNVHLLKEQLWEDYYGDVWRVSEYGKTWRCWSGYPSEEQRKAAKWE